MSIDTARIEKAVLEIIEALGEDPRREGLLETPERVARFYAEVFGGIHSDPGEMLDVSFGDEHYQEIVMVREIPFYSMCEHHFVPFHGEAHGTVEISTASGDVRIADTDAIIDVATASGRIQIERYVGSDISLKSMSGNFEVGMESGTKVDLDASSLSGRVKWPPKLDVPPEVKREVSFKAKSVSGDLTIKRLS